jgi:hypothetical protein
MPRSIRSPKYFHRLRSALRTQTWKTDSEVPASSERLHIEAFDVRTRGNAELLLEQTL